jgi:hypothetical protein
MWAGLPRAVNEAILLSVQPGRTRINAISGFHFSSSSHSNTSSLGVTKLEFGRKGGMSAALTVWFPRGLFLWMSRRKYR